MDVKCDFIPSEPDMASYCEQVQTIKRFKSTITFIGKHDECRKRSHLVTAKKTSSCTQAHSMKNFFMMAAKCLTLLDSIEYIQMNHELYQELQPNHKKNSSTKITEKFLSRNECHPYAQANEISSSSNFNFRTSSKNSIQYLTIFFMMICLVIQYLSLLASSQYHPDPRPTIYSGDVSFGLLLSAHSSPLTELSLLASSMSVNFASPSTATAKTVAEVIPINNSIANTHTRNPFDHLITASDHHKRSQEFSQSDRMNDYQSSESRMRTLYDTSHQHDKRQIFGKVASTSDSANSLSSIGSSLSTPSSSISQRNNDRGFCSIVDTDALYSGMAAIWSSHQANLIGDSYLNIGAYVYDSCGDLDVGQRQSVRIVSNLNAFQQTTCESPRGPPISVTIAHGDQQTKAIQLLTSFKVPVITTKENFDIDNYNTFTIEQKRYLFTTAPSSRFLAHGALKFSRRIMQKSSSSPLLANHNHKLSSKNGLIIISSNLPSKFINYLQETIPDFVNYGMLQSSQPIDQIKSIESLESILTTTRQTNNKRRRRRSSESTIGDDNGEQQLSNSSGSTSDRTTMISPTILLFITPAEAIDLVTRLRNDLAQVSKYYSLIVITREDITKALKTIFNRGGSSLCSGKSFYTMSPRPDDTSEFSRYFRDTVQLEGETSDHPLICEFAKHQTNTKVQAEPDELSAEPVIKAVWVAASALKSIHNRECKSSPISSSSSPNLSGLSGSSNGSAKSTNQCLLKLNRNLTQLVHKSLKRLDTVINSTGVTSLDGFRLKFDQENELMTNKYSIKYISNDCDIIELGQYTAVHGGQLTMDEENLRRSYEATLPQPWPTASSNRRSTAYRGGVVLPFERLAEASEESVNNNNDKNNSNDETDSEETDEESTSRPPINPTSENYDQSTTSNVVLHKKRLSINNNNNKSSDHNRRWSPTTVPTNSAIGHNLAALNDFDSSSASTKDNRIQKLQQQVAGALIDFIDGRRTSPTQNGNKIIGKVSAKPSDFSDVADRRWPNLGHRLDLKPSIRAMNEEQIDPSSRDAPFSSTQNSLDSISNRHSTVSSSTTTTTVPSSDFNERGGDLRAKATTEAPFSILSPSSTPSIELVMHHELSTSGKKMPLDRDDRVDDSNASKHTHQRQQNVRSTKPILNEDGSKSAVTSNYQRSSDSMYNGHTFGGGNYLSNSNDYGHQPTMPLDVTGTNSHTTSGGNIFNSFSSVPQLFNEFGPTPASPLSPLNEAGDAPSPLPINLVSSSSDINIDQTSSGTSKVKIRQHIKWIYTSWIALSILSANILGALITLYVLTFLLMKNCEGSLDRDNQSLRSIHLLTIIVVFFGSTLFVVYPTPALCLFRTSWHNFALVLLFGTLLLRAMQTRAQSSIGLGGRQNRLNQFITLIFMVSVQVAIEVQRWKYETKNVGANFIQFPLNIRNHQRRSSGNQQIPLKVSNNNQQDVDLTYAVDYCLTNADDFLHSQLYVCFIIILLILYSFTTRRENSYSGHHHCHNHHHHIGAMASSVHLVTGGPSSGTCGKSGGCVSHGNLIDGGNSFVATIICVPVYSFSIVLHVYVQNGSMRDVICSITMILIAFSVLIGIFAPIIIQIHRYGKLSSLRGTSTIEARIAQDGAKSSYTGSSSTVFNMFPELSGQQQKQKKHQKHLQRRNGFNGGFSETKQSRNNMSAALAKLGPSSADALRNMGYIDAENNNVNSDRQQHLIMDDTRNYLMAVHSNGSRSPEAIVNANVNDIRCSNEQHQRGDIDVSPSVASSESSNQNMDQPKVNLIHQKHRTNKQQEQVTTNNSSIQKQQANQLIRNHQNKVNSQTKISTINVITNSSCPPTQQGYRSYFYPLNVDGSVQDKSNFRNSQFEEQGYRCAYP